MAQYAFYPSDSSAANPSVGANGATAPGSSTQIGFEDSGGDLTNVSSSTPLPVSGTFPLPTGAATEAKQDDQITLETSANALLVDIETNTETTATETTATTVAVESIDTKTPALGQAAMAGSVPVVIANNQSEIPVSAASLPLPSGAATESKQDDEISELQTANTTLGTLATESTLQLVETATQSIDGKIFSNYGTASDAIRVAAQIGNATAVADFGSGAASAQTLRVIPASDSPAPSPPSGRSVVTTTRNDYSSTPVTTGSWVELIASTGATINAFDVFDSSGQTLELGTGAGGAETRLVLVPPGGNGPVPVAIASGSRISIRAVSAAASVGELDVNWYG